MIVEKAVNMANMMNIPIIGIVENMSWVNCPDCGKQIKIFGESKTNEVAKKFDLPLLAQIPFESKIASLCDKGEMESVENNPIADAIDRILSI